MARRGKDLREHVLWTAKDIFLELGYERASMDLVATRAETSKRSLYAHFESKEKLFLAVIDFVRDLFLGRLGFPGTEAQSPAEALTLYCARYLRGLLYAPSVQMMRMTMAEATRFPDAASLYFDVIFTEVQLRLRAYLETTGVPAEQSAAVVERLLGRILFPPLPRALFGLDAPITERDAPPGFPDVELAAIRAAVAEAIP